MEGEQLPAYGSVWKAELDVALEAQLERLTDFSRMAHPREVFRVAIMAAAYAIVLMHNHPSGDSNPSDADCSLTRRVREAGQLLRIELCDHIIVGHQRRFSFKESGII